MSMHRRRAALFTLFLLAAPVVGMGLWLRSVRHQYTLNRQLIAALVKNDTSAALALVNAGADPNTRYAPMPVPTLPMLVKQLFRRSPLPTNHSPSAFLITCGANRFEYADGRLHLHFHVPEYVPLVQAMLARGATVNDKAWDGTPLLWSMSSARPDTMRLLLEHGADADVQGLDGMTPLRWSVVTHRPKTMAVLLERGAKVNAQDELGMTALHYAAMFGRDTDTIRLLEHAANPNLVDHDGETPLSLAKRLKRLDIMALLRHAGAKK